VTESGVTVDYIEYLDWDEDFPYDNYPTSFPEVDVRLEPVREEHYKYIKQYAYEQERYPRDYNVIDQCEKALLPLGYPFTQFGGHHVMWQSIPEVTCQNPTCGSDKMDVFGVIWNTPVKGVHLWDEDPVVPDDDVQIIFQYCARCSSIYVSNRCT